MAIQGNAAANYKLWKNGTCNSKSIKITKKINKILSFSKNANSDSLTVTCIKDFRSGPKLESSRE